MKYKKRFGQHFLNDNNIVKKIVKEAELDEKSTVWEIGVGKGILTKEILNTGCKLLCFEIDKSLFHEIEGLIEEHRKNFARLIRGDVLKQDWFSLIEELRAEGYMSKEEKITVVANIPYNISTPLFFKLAEFADVFSKIVIMIQKDLAMRLKGTPSTKEYGVLTLKIQYFFSMSYLFTVKPHLFFPPPKVDSAVIKLKPRKNKPDIKDIDKYFKFLNSAFSHRRKTLRNNLKNTLTPLAIEEIERIHAKDGFPYLDLSRRAETYNEKDFLNLYNFIFAGLE